MTTGKLCRKTLAATMAIAVCAALTVHAATPLNWTGGEKATSTEESPYDIWNAANWGGTTPSKIYDLYISTNGTTYLNSEDETTQICADLCPNSGDFVFTGPLKFYCLKQGSVANSTVSIAKKSGNWEIATYGMYIGNASGTKATFVNESGYIKSTGQYKGIHIGCAPGATGIVENVLGNWAFEGDMFLAETNDTVKSDTVATFVPLTSGVITEFSSWASSTLRFRFWAITPSAIWWNTTPLIPPPDAGNPDFLIHTIQVYLGLSAGK